MKIVQIGTGGWGKNHIRILSQLGVLVGICDANSEKSKEYGEKYSVNHYETLDELLNSEDFEGAFVVTPTSTHTEITEKLLEAKKHVFVEKPMTYTSQEGEKLTRLAKKNKVILTCGYIERFNPAVDVVKKMVKEKKFGDLVMLEFHRENRMPLHIKDVGIIYDTSVHDIDTANWLFDDMPHVVFARAGKIKHEHEDFASIMLGYKDDKVAIISSNWVTPKKLRKFNAVCTDAIISSDFITQEIIVEKDDETQTVQNKKQEPLLLEIQSFLGAIEGKNEQVVKSQEAVNVTKIAEAALLSSQKGIPIYLDLK
ncbi:MAG: Gfo/Idh/MocA family oxidoreductase [Nitrosopumilus sp.]|nr:Gfo/Idh/MocA family oxidoreductase [Nitrosopumilus sp.]MDH3490329.1 Gfo/Idh/MocA family oxidoreductase [Nitrosopumilus sp.]MDH3517071.1 Gfo/Idh/MocA family oxidoreductase [Nitrosopumilus sp.]MDH3564197.1 Gfo/Idh/MocA family oxidoreductase [Nitrosopumilus sp.]MDH5417959.1 Gfo/Idh/MocA family oxidoreductase [Nitrosopumilus sp.]